MLNRGYGMRMTMTGTTVQLKRETGFTLTELLIVVAIVGALSVVAVPNFLDWNRKYQMKDATGLLQANLALARMSAVNQSTTVTVTLSQPSGNGPVNVTFRNTAGSDVLPALNLNTLLSLSDVNGNAAGSPQTLQFNSMGLKVNTGNANNICVASSGAVTACSKDVSQAFNVRNTQYPNFNYRVVVASTGKVSWCYTSSCGQ